MSGDVKVKIEHFRRTMEKKLAPELEPQSEVPKSEVPKSEEVPKCEVPKNEVGKKCTKVKKRPKAKCPKVKCREVPKSKVPKTRQKVKCSICGNVPFGFKSTEDSNISHSTLNTAHHSQWCQ